MTEPDQQSLLPKRSKNFGVGKEIGGNVYVHKQYEELLGSVISTAKNQLEDDFDYAVIKLNLQTRAVTFIVSPDFDTAPEPELGAYVLIREDGSVMKRAKLSDPYIYHHKWLMVKDDYAGFDVSESRQRSSLWLSLADVDKTRIGRKSFWESNVVPRISKPSR